MDEIIEQTATTYTVHIEDGYILGIATADGTEVTTEFDLYHALDENFAPAYYLDGDTVRPTTVDERTAWVEAHKPTVEDSTEDIMLEMLADHEERICLMELGVEE